MIGFNSIVQGFNERSFTYADDVMNAFAGTMAVLSRSFTGGFLWGTPVMFFDLGLVWRVMLDVRNT